MRCGCRVVKLWSFVHCVPWSKHVHIASCAEFRKKWKFESPGTRWEIADLNVSGPVDRKSLDFCDISLAAIRRQIISVCGAWAPDFRLWCFGAWVSLTVLRCQIVYYIQYIHVHVHVCKHAPLGFRTSIYAPWYMQTATPGSTLAGLLPFLDFPWRSFPWLSLTFLAAAGLVRYSVNYAIVSMPHKW